MDEEYRFHATANDGRITQSKDWVSGEEVSYQYDTLNRLIAAFTTGLLVEGMTARGQDTEFYDSN